MSFRPKTNAFKSDIGTFHMLVGTPFHVSRVQSYMDEKTIETAFGQGFLMLEGYLYEFEPNGDSDIAQYWYSRANLSIKERIEVFGFTVDASRFDLLLDAWSATRDSAHEDVIDTNNPDAVAAKKNNSKASFETASMAENTPEN